MNLNKASLILELTHLRKGDKYWKDYDVDTELEPIHTGFNKEHWNQRMEATGKTGSLYEKIYNSPFRCLTQIPSHAFPHHFRSN